MANKVIELTDKERQEIYLSLSVRCGFIETDTMHRAVDMEAVFLEDLMEKVF